MLIFLLSFYFLYNEQVNAFSNCRFEKSQTNFKRIYLDEFKWKQNLSSHFTILKTVQQYILHVTSVGADSGREASFWADDLMRIKDG